MAGPDVPVPSLDGIDLMAWSWGGAAQGASRGIGALIDLLQYKAEEKERSEERRLRDERLGKIDARQSAADAFENFMRTQNVRDAGGFVPEEIRRAPVFPGGGMAPIPFPERDVSVADVASPEGLGRIKFDASRSVAGRDAAAKEAAAARVRQALGAYSTDPSPTNRSAALSAGANPADVVRFDPKAPEAPRAPVMGSPEWERAIDFQARTQAKYRPPPASANRPPQRPTEGQEKSAIYFGLMGKGTEDMQRIGFDLEGRPNPRIRPMNIKAALSLPFGNIALNKDEQEYLRAARDFAAGVLRKESGAAIKDDELRDVFARFIDAPFDKEETRKVKAEARKRYMGLMERAARPALLYYEAVEGKEPPPATDDDMMEEMLLQFLGGRRQ